MKGSKSTSTAPSKPSRTNRSHDWYDAVIIPGGGLESHTALPQPWVRARLDAAFELDEQTKCYIALSRGTTHKAPPLDSQCFPISESAASAHYLIAKGVKDPARILLDTWSLDTIGNAFFAVEMICKPMKFSRCCVITSVFHMPRTREIFEWVFGLSDCNIDLEFTIVPDVGLDDSQSYARREKERESLVRLQTVTIPRIDTMTKLAEFVFREHGAYSSRSLTTDNSAVQQKESSDDVTSTY